MTLILGVTTAQQLTVFAASSLTEAFKEMAQQFENQHQGITLQLNFAGSSLLSTQISQGARADIFASANLEQMQRLIDEKLVSETHIFTTNQMALISSESSSLTTLSHLAEKNFFLVLANQNVPAGQYSREVIAKLDDARGNQFAERFLRNLVSEESNVRQAALKVEIGEADAAIVYSTDVLLLSNVNQIDIPQELNIIATYPIAVTEDSRQTDLARTFVEFVLSDEGQSILQERGFGRIEE